MSSGNYAGVEIPSVVLDVGYESTRIGHAGEDCPRGIFSTSLGKRLGEAEKGVDGPFNKQKNNSKYIGGISEQISVLENCDVVNPLKAGEIVDWEAFEAVCSYAFNHKLRQASNEQPLLFSEYSWANLKQREKVTELMFELYDVPALYLARNAVLASFANGKTTSLVFDCGASVASAVPVYDGYVLKRGIVKQNFGGDTINEFILEELNRQYNYQPTPSYAIKSRSVPEAGTLPEIVKKQIDNVTDSFNRFSIKNAVSEFKESTCQIFETTYDQAAISTRPGRPYEFQDGFNMLFGSERFRYAEMLFQPNVYNKNDPAFVGIHKLVAESINKVDIDLKPHLCSNIVLSGGTTLLNGFNDRMYFELNNMFYGQRIKMSHGSNSVDRKYTNWLGGSILASLGTFNQLWLSKAEFMESGTSIIEKKFA